MVLFVIYLYIYRKQLKTFIPKKNHILWFSFLLPTQYFALKDKTGL